MPIRFNTFGGLIPRVHSEKLPDMAAQTAENCRLARGVLEPLNVVEPFTTMVESNGTLKSGIPAADLISITKPTKPTLLTGVTAGPGGILWLERGIHHIAQPYWWLKVIARTWLVTVKQVRDGPDIYEKLSIQKLQEVALSPKFGTVRYTEAGFTFSVEIPPFDATFTREIGGLPVDLYKICGPLFQFVLLGNGVGGSPDDRVLMPFIASHLDSQIPASTCPLTYNGNIYADFQVHSVVGVQYNNEFNLQRGASSRVVHFPSEDDVATATFVIQMNYVYNRRRHVYYIQTAVTNDGEEGPPSELSGRITVQPGEYVKLNTPRPDGYAKNKLYRSTTGGDDFYLLADVNADTYIDDMRDVTATVLPPYGNHPDCNAATFLEGSIIHPEQFAAAFYEDNLYLSDYYRFWVWPEEYAIGFQDNIDAIALSGNTILVFTNGKVYGVSGGNPAHMAKFLISENMDLLSKRTLATIGSTVVYASSIGLIGVTGGQARNLTEKFYKPEEWLALDPANMTAKVADNAVFLQRADGTGLRVDFDENETAITTYTTTSGGDFTWKSKRFQFEEKRIFEYARIVATGAVTLKAYADGTLASTANINEIKPSALSNVPFAHAWEFQVEGDCIVREMEFYDRQTIPVGDQIALTPNDVPLWENIWLKFQDRNAFVAGILTVQGEGAVPIRFYQSGDTLVHTQTVTNGNVFMLPRNMAKSAYWRISIETERPIERLELFAQITQDAGNVIRELHPGGIPPWRLKRYEIADKATPTGAVVHARTNVVMNLYVDGSQTVTQQVTIPAGGHARIPDLGTARWVEFDFGGSDAEVSEVILHASPTPIVGPDGVSLTRPPCWRGNRFRFADRGVFACGLIEAKSYSALTLTLYADGSEVYSELVTAGTMFYLPTTLSEATVWEVDVQGAGEVESVLLLPRTRVPSRPEISLTANDTGLPPWAAARYELPEAVEYRSAIVKADSYSDLKLTLRSGGTTYSVDVADGTEFLLPGMGRVSDLELNFGAKDYVVNEVYLFPKEVIPVPQNGIVIRQASGTRSWRRKVLAFPEIGSFSVVRVVASSYATVKFRLIVGGELKYETDITSDAEIKLPSTLPNAREWEMDLTQAGDVYEFYLIGRVSYTVQDGTVLIRREGDPFTFMDKHIMSSMPISFSCGRVLATSYPVTVRLYYGNRHIHTAQALDERAFRLPRMRPERLWSADFIAPDGAMIHEAALATSMDGLRQ